jgi:hypothetical protein
MLPQDRLRVLLALYDRRLDEVAAAFGATPSFISRVINCRVRATPPTIRRVELAIIYLGKGIPANALPTSDTQEGPVSNEEA